MSIPTPKASKKRTVQFFLMEMDIDFFLSSHVLVTLTNWWDLPEMGSKHDGTKRTKSVLLILRQN